jgi:hypothetical protein
MNLEPDILPAGAGTMQVDVGAQTSGVARQSLNALSPAPDPDDGPSLLELLRTFGWVHRLGGTVACEGCANDGDEGYCLGATPADLSDQSEAPISCVCGHSIEVAWYPDRPDDGRWRCAGEDSEHWPQPTFLERDGQAVEVDYLLAECGHCVWSPSEAEAAEYVLAGGLTLSLIEEIDGRDYAATVGNLALVLRDQAKATGSLR